MMRTLIVTTVLVAAFAGTCLPLLAEEYEATLKLLTEKDATAPTAAEAHDFDAFLHGRIAGIRLRDGMSDVVRKWGKPVELSGSHSGRIWTHYYTNARLLYHDFKLVRIILGRMGNLDCRFTNGLSGALTRAEVITVLGVPKNEDGNRAGMHYTSGEYSLDLQFMVKGHFPENDAEWSEARLATISVECSSSVR